MELRVRVGVRVGVGGEVAMHDGKIECVKKVFIEERVERRD